METTKTKLTKETSILLICILNAGTITDEQKERLCDYLKIPKLTIKIVDE